MATNIGNKLLKSGTDLFFTTLGMPNTSENMYKTVLYCDTYSGMEGTPTGTIIADTTYSKSQSNIVTGKHTFDSTTGLHTNIWTWNENSNTTGSDSGSVSGAFSLSPTSISNISVDGGAISFQPTGLNINRSPNVTSFRYVDEPISVSIGTHSDTYDYGGTINFKTSDAVPKGIAQNYYNRDAPYYILSLASKNSWVTPLSKDITITSNNPSTITFNVDKQTLSSKSGEGLYSHCTTSNIVAKEGGSKTLNLNYWNGTTYQGFTIPSANDRTFNITYNVSVKNSTVTPSGLTGTTITITQNGKTGALTYTSSITAGSDFATLTKSDTNTPVVTFSKQTYKKGAISGTISLSDTEILVDEYSDLTNKVAPSTTIIVDGWHITDPINSTNRTATISSKISWANVDTVNTNPTTVSYTFTQQGVTYNQPSGQVYVKIQGDDMSKHPTITNGDYSNGWDVWVFYNCNKNNLSKQIDIQFPWIRPDNIGGSANGSVIMPDNVSDTSNYIADAKTWSPSISSNITFVNSHVEAQKDMEWELSVADFIGDYNDIDDTTSFSTASCILTQMGNEYSESTITTVGVSATSDKTWLVPQNTIALTNNSSSGNITFKVSNNNAILKPWSINNFSRTSNNIVLGLSSSSSNTSSRTANITWKTTNSGSGTITANHNTSTYTQAASSISGTVKLTITGSAISGGTLTQNLNYPVTSSTYTVPSSRIIKNRNWWNTENIEVLIDYYLNYDDTEYEAQITNFGNLETPTRTSYTIAFTCQDLSVGSKKIISNGVSSDSTLGPSYLSPSNASVISGTYYTTNLGTTYTTKYRTWLGTTAINNTDKIPDLPSSGWSNWQTTTDEYLTVDIGDNKGSVYSKSISKNSNSTLQGGWSLRSGGRNSSTDRYFAVQIEITDNNNATYTNTVGDFYWQQGDQGASNGDKIAFTLSSTSNCSVSGNYATLQVGSSIPSSVSISPNYSSGTKSWYKDGNYYGTSEPTPIYSTSWSGSICSNTNNNGASTVPIWADLSNYDKTCGVTGGTSSYTNTTSSPSFTKYYTYPWSATMYPTGYSSLSKTQNGTGTSSTTIVEATSSSTVYNRYVSWDGGSTWGTTLTKTLSSNNYSLNWRWKYAISTSASALYSGSGSCSVTKATSSTMTFNGSMTLTSSDGTIYQTQSQTVTCSISNNTTSGTETSAGQTRTVSTTTKIYYSLDNSNWTEGSSYTFSTTTSTSVGNHIIYWKCVATASGYSSSSKTFTGTSTIYVKQRYTTETKTEYNTTTETTGTKTSYSGTAPSVLISGAGNIDYWTLSKTVSASSSSSTSVTQTITTTYQPKRQPIYYQRTYDALNNSYSDWAKTGEGAWENNGSETSNKSTSTVTGSITIQYSLNNSSWTNGSSYVITPSSTGSSGTSTGTSTTVYFRALLYYSGTLVATGGSSPASVAKYGISYYNE